MRVLLTQGMMQIPPRLCVPCMWEVERRFAGIEFCKADDCTRCFAVIQLDYLKNSSGRAKTFRRDGAKHTSACFSANALPKRLPSSNHFG